MTGPVAGHADRDDAGGRHIHALTDDVADARLVGRVADGLAQRQVLAENGVLHVHADPVHGQRRIHLRRPLAGRDLRHAQRLPH